jgi:hypothetical protein
LNNFGLRGVDNDHLAATAEPLQVTSADQSRTHSAPFGASPDPPSRLKTVGVDYIDGAVRDLTGREHLANAYSNADGKPC